MPKTPVNKTDSTRNQRQERRRKREKVWLRENGWSSWEALHTALMKGSVIVVPAQNSSEQVQEK